MYSPVKWLATKEQNLKHFWARGLTHQSNSSTVRQNCHFTQVEYNKWFIMISSALIDLWWSNLPGTPSVNPTSLVPAWSQKLMIAKFSTNTTCPRGTVCVGKCAFFKTLFVCHCFSLCWHLVVHVFPYDFYILSVCLRTCIQYMCATPVSLYLFLFVYFWMCSVCVCIDVACMSVRVWMRVCLWETAARPADLSAVYE